MSSQNQNVNWIPKVDPEPEVFDIIQPVLQYPGDNGNYWSVKSWYVTLNSGVLVTPEISCQPGDVIYGNMTMTKSGMFSGTWFIGGTNWRTGQTAGLSADKARLKKQPWAYTTVECYGCQDCSFLPTNELIFSGMTAAVKGTNAPLSWTAYTTPNPVCHTTAHIQSSERVTYSFQQ